MLSCMLDENGNYNKNYKILDQLGNTHIVLKNSEIIGSYMYEPFGKQITLFSENQTRLSFIGKEKDIESELGDFGVRKYDNEIGRFTSIDPLWEKYYSWTPYHYCSNNPVMGSDPGGKADGATLTAFEAFLIQLGQAVGIPTSVSVGILLTPLVLTGDSSPTQSKTTVQTKEEDPPIIYMTIPKEKEQSNTMEARNLANNPQKLGKLKGNKTSANSPKMDGGNKDIWNRFKEALKQKSGDGYKEYMENNPDLRRELHDFQKPFKVGQNVPKEDIPKVINEFIKQLEG
jgi:RHS repeat-associated protein